MGDHSKQELRHCHPKNCSLSSIIALGDFTRGQLELGGVGPDAKHCVDVRPFQRPGRPCDPLFDFDPQEAHRARAHDGERIVVTYYTLRGVQDQLKEQDREYLADLGFPLPDTKKAVEASETALCQERLEGNRLMASAQQRKSSAKDLREQAKREFEEKMREADQEEREAKELERAAQEMS